MLKKIFYGIGGFILLFIILAVIFPAPNPTKVQEGEQKTQEVTVVKPSETATAPTPTFTETKTTVVQAKKVQTVSSTPPPTKLPTSQFTYYSVSSVVDGDTIKINKDGKVETLRLIGIDTPETVDPRKPVQCFGKEASNKAKELLSGRKVRIEVDPSQGTFDKYGRTLAYVYRDDGLFYNKHMIEQGYAHEYTYNTPYKYQVEFKAAQKAAENAQRGLWSLNTCSGDTTSSNTSTQTAPATTQATGKYYTSSYYSSKYYYPETCDGWKTLSAQYLKSFSSLDSLLSSYPSRIKSPQCN